MIVICGYKNLSFRNREGSSLVVSFFPFQRTPQMQAACLRGLFLLEIVQVCLNGKYFWKMTSRVNLQFGQKEVSYFSKSISLHLRHSEFFVVKEIHSLTHAVSSCPQ